MSRALRHRYGRARTPFSERTEKELSALGRCTWQTAYGDPYITRCGRKVKPGHVWCASHERDARELYPHLPVPMRRSA